MGEVGLDIAEVWCKLGSVGLEMLDMSGSYGRLEGEGEGL